MFFQYKLMLNLNRYLYLRSVGKKKEMYKAKEINESKLKFNRKTVNKLKMEKN